MKLLKARKNLKWSPKITLEELINEMINFDLQEARKESLLSKSFSNKSK